MPETAEALQELARQGDGTVAQSLYAVSHEAENLVPLLVGLSLTFVDEDLTFTMCSATSPRVASSLSLPVEDAGGHVVAAINLYAAAAHAFDGRHEQLASVCGAQAAGAVTDADLWFTSRAAATEAPGRIRDDRAVDQAIGALMALHELDDCEAEERLHRAAGRAGASDPAMARAVLALSDIPVD